MLVNIAVASEACDGRAPRAGIRRSTVNIRGDSVPSPEPNRDGLGGDFCRYDPTTSLVERSAEAVGVGVLDTATGILALGGVIDIAVRGLEMALEAGVLDTAALVRVQRDAVVRAVVYSLEDIDFAVLGPFRPAA